MMDECSEEVGTSGANPFDDVEPDTTISSISLQIQSKPITQVPSASTNPFEDEKESTNPFEMSDDPPAEDHETGAEYEYVSLTAPSTGHSSRRSNLDWEMEWEQVAGAVKKNFTVVSVTAPEIVSTMMTKHVVYTVKTDSQRFVVRRRYNDFAWLRDVLAATYEGLFIPSIPATTIFSSKNTLSGGSKTDVNGDFVKNRMAQLHLFMQQLCKIPFLRTDPSLQSFLQVQNEKEFKQITEAPVEVANGGGVSNWTNVGLSMWIKLVEGTPLNAEVADRLVADFRRQLDVLGTSLCAVDNECRVAGRKAVVGAAAISFLTEHVTAWSAVEAELADVSRNEYVDPYGKTKKGFMDALTVGNLHWSHSVGMVPKIVARVLMSNVQFQQVQVARFKEHLQARDALVKELERAEREKAKALEDKQRAASPSSASKRQGRTMIFSKSPEDLEEILRKKVEQVTGLQARLDRITKGLVFCEIHRFNKDRLHSISTLVGSLAAVHLQIAQSSASRWNEIATQLGVDVNQYSDTVGALVSASALDEDLVFNSD